MAGMPRLKAMGQAIEALGGIEYICDRISSEGIGLKRLAKQIAETSPDPECAWSRQSLYKWLHRTPERWARFQVARRESAAALLEEGLEILDDPENQTDNARVSAAKNRAHFRSMLAGFYNREEYGEGPKHQVQVNIGTLHLDALRAKGGPPPRSLPAPVPALPPVDAEIVEDVA
jgi:hypothetical protein